jgi:hypothetical protein
MTHLGSGECIAAVEMMLIFCGGLGAGLEGISTKMHLNVSVAAISSTMA